MIENQNLLSLLRRLYCHINIRRKVQFILLIIFSVITSFSEILSIGAIYPFIGVLTSPQKFLSILTNYSFLNHFLKYNTNQFLILITIVFIIAIIISNFFKIALLWSQSRFSFGLGSDLSNSVFKKTLLQNYEVHLSRNSSEIISTMSSKLISVISQVILPILTLISSIIIIIFIVLGLLIFNPSITLLTFLGIAIIYLLIALFSRKKLLKDSNIINKESNILIKIIQEGLGGIRDILLNNSQEFYCSIYRKSDISLRKAQARVTFVGIMPRYLIEMFAMIFMVLLAYKLTLNTDGVVLALPILGTLVLSSQRILPLFQQIFGNWASIKGSQSAFIDVLELLEQETSSVINFENHSNKIAFNNAIKFNNVYFKYSASDQFILKNINIEIKKGARVGIIGTTGSGKSTFVDLIMRLLIPNNGEIYIDNVLLDEKNYKDWKSKIAHVPQSIYLSDSTIAENIAFGIPSSEIDFDLVKDAAKKAQISDTIEKWKNGYQTLVGERGARLSGGQKQRIGIARAMYKNAKIIIFDEATSALDNETEKSVIESIENLDKDLTIFIIAHRLTTLKNCNIILKIENSGISEVTNYK
jgi:ABC-type multidrug transport system fused ATPase/permease subunit